MLRNRVLAFAGILAFLFSAILVPSASAQTANGPDYDIPNGHFYTQANGGAGAQYGYRITNDGGIGFWNEFQRLGGVAALGYPASTRFTMDGFTVQATQKVILQWRPEVNQVYFINVFDKLHDLGDDATLQAQFQIPSQLDPSFDAGKSPEQIQAARLALLDSDAAIKSTYNGSSNALLYEGLPTSNVTDEGPFFTLRTQRVAIQHWKADNPAAGIHAGDVSVVNGGDIAKKLNLVPASAQIPETAQGQPASAPSPSPSAPPVASPAPSSPAPSSYQFHIKSVNTPPVKCGSDVPCVDSAANTGVQYVTGHVMDINGNPLAGMLVEWTFYGNSQTVGTDGNGKFTFTIATNCPIQQRVYTIFVVDGQGHQVSDPETVTYNNCNTAGEFHFDFIRNS